MVIRFDRQQQGLNEIDLRVGGQADVIAYTGEAGAILRPLGKFFIQLMSWFSHAY